MNLFVWFCHRFIVFPILRWLIRWSGPSRRDLVLRGSLLTPEFFHWAWSDIDLALILTDVEERSFPLRLLQAAKKAYPFIGEVEVYTFEEWMRLVSLKDAAQTFYAPARQVRKLGWLGPAPHGYLSKIKYERGRSMMAAKMGLPAHPITQQEAVQCLLQKLCTQDLSAFTGAASYFHTYFKAFISVPPHAEAQESLKLSSGEAVWLAAWFPHDDTISNAQLVIRMGEEAHAQKQLLLEIDVLEKRGSQLGVFTEA